MNRMIGTVTALVVIALLLPTITAVAVEAVPFLLSLLLFLVGLRVLLPPTRRR